MLEVCWRCVLEVCGEAWRCGRSEGGEGERGEQTKGGQGKLIAATSQEAEPGSSRVRGALFMKNCEPPELGEPVLAIERVPGSLEILAANSSLMLPPPLRVSVPPVTRFL